MQQSDTLVLACPRAFGVHNLASLSHETSLDLRPLRWCLHCASCLCPGLAATQRNRYKAEPRMPLIEASCQLSLHDTGQQLILRTLPSRVPSRRVFPTDAPCLQVAWPPMKAPCVRKPVASKLAANTSPPQLCSNIKAFIVGAMFCNSDNTAFFRSRTYMPLSIKLVLSTIIEKNKANLRINQPNKPNQTKLIRQFIAILHAIHIHSHPQPFSILLITSQH